MHAHLRHLHGVCTFCGEQKDDVFGCVEMGVRRSLVCGACAPAVRDVVLALCELAERDAALSPTVLDRINDGFHEEPPTDPDMTP